MSTDLTLELSRVGVGICDYMNRDPLVLDHRRPRTSESCTSGTCTVVGYDTSHRKISRIPKSLYFTSGFKTT